MQGALSVGKYFNIPLKVHWTFGFFLFFIVYISVQEQLNTQEIVGAFLYLAMLFILVILHEFGHALAARKYGIITRDIILTPIGGLARMEKLPEIPFREFVVAIAGPLVNLCIGIISVFLLVIIGSDANPPNNEYLFYQSFSDTLKFIIIVNSALFLFNLIPAFPMDGGRILRSLLAMKLGRLNSTRIASFIGQAIAIAFVVFGLLNQYYVLAFIGGFIFLSAANERKFIIQKNRLKKTRASEIMDTNYHRIQLGNQFKEVFKISQDKPKNYLVFNEFNEWVGILPELYIKEALDNDLGQQTIQSLMQRKMFYVSPEDNLEHIFNLMQSRALAIIAVKEGDQIIGAIDRSMVQSFLT